ncbi:AGAP010772-PA-like protein [Anopheles sinensis]|uniref:AGAP010772-PA-like protein n=1 Tax=Anopheles sinensis TaxID=74873 RepID=A0A084W7F2_ANOSI|nr:AGAP010772-PA-like protein [Anopheles sinensis]
MLLQEIYKEFKDSIASAEERRDASEAEQKSKKSVTDDVVPTPSDRSQASVHELNSSEEVNRHSGVETYQQGKTRDTSSVYKSCKEVPTNESGIYRIQFKPNETLEVYCEQSTFGGGWLVFTYRYGGELDFERSWDDFRNGFGNLNDEFWMGLEFLHQLTSARKYELLFEIDWDDGPELEYYHFDEFVLGSEDQQYILNFGKNNGTEGFAGSFSTLRQGTKFSTKDRDNDEESTVNCAEMAIGGWWYKQCLLRGSEKKKHAASFRLMVREQEGVVQEMKNTVRTKDSAKIWIDPMMREQHGDMVNKTNFQDLKEVVQMKDIVNLTDKTVREQYGGFESFQERKEVRMNYTVRTNMSVFIMIGRL